MATRIKEWLIPYTWWDWIDISENHVISVLLRAANNLIMVNEDRELYVDLQLPDGIEPDDDFPVGVTTWRILAEDWWDQNGTILNWKTTSGDYVRIIYANDGNLYYDPWTWEWIRFATENDLSVATSTKLWLIKLGSDTVQTEPIQTPTSTSGRSYAVQLNANNQAIVNVPWVGANYSSLPEEQWGTDLSLVTTWEKYIWNHKQDTLTAWSRITIDQNNVISADVSGVLTYKWNVTGIADLPSSGNVVWDTYFVEGVDAMYSWDWTQWNYVGSTSPSLSQYFNKTIDDSDDVTEWTYNLFVTAAEKAAWNAKQDALTAWDWITLSNNVISAVPYTAWDAISITNRVVSNTKPFDPENTGTLGQVLKRTSTGYRRANESWAVTSVNGQTWDVTVDEFEPSNTWTTGQVLTKTASGYSWQNGWGWGSGNFNPENTGTTGQVLTKTATGYEWETNTWLGNVKAFLLDLDNYTSEELGEIIEWVNRWTDYCAVVKLTQWDVCVYSHQETSSSSIQYHFFSPKYNVETTNATNGDFTTLYNTELIITSTNGVRTATKHDFNNYANFLKVEDSGYTTPYMPTQSHQPATKAYVDAVAAGSVQVQAITNNTTGTTYTLQQERVWTQAQYDSLTPINWVIYNIIPSS